MKTRTYETNSKLALRIPGEETNALGEKCKQYGFYLAGAAFEKVDGFPNHFFNTGFIISPEGEVILKYRKINASNNNIEISASPVDVLNRYDNDIILLTKCLTNANSGRGTYDKCIEPNQS
jgi:hypothetical protein